MTEQYTSGALPFPYHHADNLDISKHSPPSTTNVSTYESDSPSAAHSFTTASSHLSGSYEPSQVSSYMEEQMAQPQINKSPPLQQQQYPLTVASNMNTNMGIAASHASPNTVHAPYTNYQTYPGYYLSSPVVQEHPSYPYGPVHVTPEQHYVVPAARPMYFSAPIGPPSPSPAGVYYSYDYPSAATLHSPITPYMYPQPVLMIYMPPTPTPQYSPQVSPAPIPNGQAEPAVPSLLRPSQPAPPLPSCSINAAPSRRSASTLLYSSASSLGHQAALRAGHYQQDQQEAPTPARILTDFKKFELKDIFGHCAEFSTDQYGSHFIQQKLELATRDERQIVFDEIVTTGNLPRLVMDAFGNYVIQRLLQYGPHIQRIILCGQLKTKILSLSLDMYGCRVIQRAIECTSRQQQSAIIAELDENILKCVKDFNGNHVIRTLLEHVIHEHMRFINTFTDNVYDLAMHPHGSRILQACLEHVSPEQLRPLLDELHQNAMALMQDQFGNYVIQFVLERGSTHDRNRMIDVLTHQFSAMSRHKFASNVCEKAIAVADPTGRRRIVEEMLASGSTGINIMMEDQHANHVLQKAIKLVEGDLLESLIAAVMPQLISKRGHPTMVNSKQFTSIEKLLKEKGFSLDAAQPFHLVISPPVSQEDEITTGSATP